MKENRSETSLILSRFLVIQFKGIKCCQNQDCSRVDLSSREMVVDIPAFYTAREEIGARPDGRTDYEPVLRLVTARSRSNTFQSRSEQSTLGFVYGNCSM